MASAREWRVGAERAFAVLQSSGATVIWVRDTPGAPFNVAHCVDRAAWRGTPEARCHFPLREALGRDLFALEQEAAAVQHVRTLDMSEYVCPGAVCKPRLGSLYVFRDSNHITAELSRSLAPVFSRILQGLPSRTERLSAADPTKAPADSVGAGR